LQKTAQNPFIFAKKSFESASKMPPYFTLRLRKKAKKSPFRANILDPTNQ